LHRRACREGIVTLSTQEVNSFGGHPSHRRSLAMTSTQRKTISSALTRMMWQLRQISHENMQPPRSQIAGSVSTLLVMHGSSEKSCVRCKQVDNCSAWWQSYRRK